MTPHPILEWLHKCVGFFVATALIFSHEMGFADSDLSKDQIPKAVLEAFQSAYPKARGIEYDLEMENGKKVYEIEFKNGRRRLVLHYLEDGSLIQSDNKDSDSD